MCLDKYCFSKQVLVIIELHEAHKGTVGAIWRFLF